MYIRKLNMIIMSLEALFNYKQILLTNALCIDTFLSLKSGSKCIPIFLSERQALFFNLLPPIKIMKLILNHGRPIKCFFKKLINFAPNFPYFLFGNLLWLYTSFSRYNS
jgi:hypothetical protein